MKLPPLNSSFKKDNRGVSEIIGIIVLFGFLIVGLAGYQAQVVPQQNSEIEFQHFQEVQNDLVEVRSAVSTAGQSGVARYPTVTLGTDYPTRIFTLNPPSPSGTLQTSSTYDIRIDNQSGNGPKNVSTQFLEYKNGYNELDIGSIWYENSVLYLDERNTGGGIVAYEDQNIINGNESARVTALQNYFRASSTGRVTLDLEPTENAGIGSSDLEGNVTIKIPTRLNGTTYWDEAIDTTESDSLWYHGTEPYPGESDIYWVNLTVDADKLRINTVGIQGEPEAQDSIRQEIGLQDGGDDNNGKRDESALVLVDGSTPDEERYALKFDIENGRQNPVTITEFSLSTPGNQNSAVSDSVGNINRDATNNMESSAEVQIRDNEVLGYATPDSGQNQDNFDADGDPYLMDRNGQDGRGQEATIDSGAVVSVDMGEFNNGNVGLKYSSVDNKEDSDLTATFNLEDGTTVEFYFRVTNVNS